MCVMANAKKNEITYASKCWNSVLSMSYAILYIKDNMIMHILEKPLAATVITVLRK